MPTHGGLIWTNHALQRIKERKIPQEYAAQTYRTTQGFPGTDMNTTEYQKYFGNHLVTVIVAKNDRKEDIIVSCWAEPPFAGSADLKKKQQYWEYKKAGILKKIWLSLKFLVGL